MNQKKWKQAVKNGRRAFAAGVRGEISEKQRRKLRITLRDLDRQHRWLLYRIYRLIRND